MRTDPHAFVIRKGRLAERDRLREFYRDAVLVAGPRSYTREQVAIWAATADDVDRWDTWMREGSAWVAVEPRDPARAIGVASPYPQDHVHLLYVDPAFHRRGIARARRVGCRAGCREP